MNYKVIACQTDNSRRESRVFEWMNSRLAYLNPYSYSFGSTVSEILPVTMPQVKPGRFSKAFECFNAACQYLNPYSYAGYPNDEEDVFFNCEGKTFSEAYLANLREVNSSSSALIVAGSRAIYDGPIRLLIDPMSAMDPAFHLRLFADIAQCGLHLTSLVASEEKSHPEIIKLLSYIKILTMGVSLYSLYCSPGLAIARMALSFGAVGLSTLIKRDSSILHHIAHFLGSFWADYLINPSVEVVLRQADRPLSGPDGATRAMLTSRSLLTTNRDCSSSFSANFTGAGLDSQLFEVNKHTWDGNLCLMEGMPFFHDEMMTVGLSGNGTRCTGTEVSTKALYGPYGEACFRARFNQAPDPRGSVRGAFTISFGSQSTVPQSGGPQREADYEVFGYDPLGLATNGIRIQDGVYTDSSQRFPFSMPSGPFGWHSLCMNISREKVTFKMDGGVIRELTDPALLPSAPFFMRMNAWAANWAGTLPNGEYNITMDIASASFTPANLCTPPPASSPSPFPSPSPSPSPFPSPSPSPPPTLGNVTNNGTTPDGGGGNTAESFWIKVAIYGSAAAGAVIIGTIAICCTVRHCRAKRRDAEVVRSAQEARELTTLPSKEGFSPRTSPLIVGIGTPSPALNSTGTPNASSPAELLSAQV